VGRSWVISRVEQILFVAPMSAATLTRVAAVSSTTEDFTSWSTTRTPWRDYASISGDEGAAAAFLDALNLI
jgi:hypothetical protein